MAEHEEYLILISARLDGELRPEEEERLRSHLAACPDCRRAAEELRAIHDAMGQLPLLEPPPGFKDRVLAEIENTGKGRTEKPVWRRWLAAAAVLIFLAGVGRQALPLFYSKGGAVSGAGFDADAAVPQAASGGAAADHGGLMRSPAAEVEGGDAQDSGSMRKESVNETGDSVSAACVPAGEAQYAPQTRDVNGFTPAVAPEQTCAPYSDTSASAGVTKDEQCVLSAPSAAAPSQAAITPRQALELVVAQVNAESAQALQNVYGQEEERLVCTNTLTQDSTVVSTVNYAGIGEAGYLFTLNAADGGEVSRYAVRLDGSEVLDLTP